MTFAPALAPATVRANWWRHAAEGALGIAALTCLTTATVGTALVEHLGGAPWMIAAMAVLIGLGFGLGPLVVMHRIDSLPLFLPAVCRSYLASRLPMLAISALLLTGTSSSWMAWVVLAGYAWFGFAHGLGIGAWQQLFARTVAKERRAGLLAVRYLGGSLVGLGLGWVIAEVLRRWPGTVGFGVLHLLAIGCWMVAYVVLRGIREVAPPDEPAAEPMSSWVRYIRPIPALLAGHRPWRWFLASTCLVNVHYLLIAFLALHAGRRTGLGAAVIGDLTLALTAGACAGTAMATVWGDRLGPWRLLLGGHALFLLAALGALAAASRAHFLALFALYGAGLYTNRVGQNAMALALVPATGRAALLALFNAAGIPSMLLASQAGALLWLWEADFAWTAGLTAVGLTVSMATLLPLSERREQTA